MNDFYFLVGFGCLLIVVLAMNVSRVRYKFRIAHGDRDNKVLRNAMVAHSNAIEHIIPFCLITYVLVEQNTSSFIIHLLVFGFLLARLAHAVGITMFVFRVWQIASGFSYLITIFSSCLILYNLTV